MTCQAHHIFSCGHIRHPRSALILSLPHVYGPSLAARSGIEVFGMMDGRVDLVLDAGACVGEGATTVDITEPYWKIIREGAVQEKEIADVLQAT